MKMSAYSNQGSSKFSITSRLPRLLATIAIVIVLFPPVAASPAVKGQEDQGTVIVRLSQEAYARVADIQAVHTIGYGSFVWLELTSSNFEKLRASRVEFERQRDPTVLKFQEYRFDTRIVDQPSVPMQQTSVYESGTPGLYVVQLLGPSKHEWLAHLKASGLEILQYFAPHAHLVRMTPEQASTTKELDFVRWVGPYHPAYRIPLDLLERSGIIENVSVTIYDDGQADGTVDRTIEIIEALGGKLIHQEKTRADEPLVMAVFTLPAAALTSTAQLDNVVWVNYQRPEWFLEDEMSDQIIAGNFDPLEPGYQTWLSSKGVDGSGVTVALVDTGYDTGDNATAHPDVRGRLIPLDTSILPGFQPPDDDNGHGTHVGGIIAANASLGITDTNDFLMGLGVAPEVSLVVRDSRDSSTDLQRDSVTNGAVASNNSYGVQNASSGYTGDDRTLDELVRDANPSTATVAEPLIIVFSAGNCGAGQPDDPCYGNTGPTKEAKNVIAVGATRNHRDGGGTPGTGNIDNVWAGSSRGPAGDDRIYPHVVAPGDNIISTKSSVCTGLGRSCTEDADGAPPTDPTYTCASGTSMAAPHVTGAAALITEWWRGFHAGTDPSPAMVKALLVNGAVDIGAADIPNGNEGWGRINLDNVIVTGIPTATVYVNQTTVFTTTGQTWSAKFATADPAQPVKVSLAWTDAPGPGGGGNPAALVNDLDLVVDQDGTVYHGAGGGNAATVFANGFSTTGGSADRVDNLENVFIENPSGTFTVTVTAADINGDGVPYNGHDTDQDFALVCRNCLGSAVDVYFLVDLSSSFSDDLPVFKAQAPDLISSLRASNPNSRFGLGKFEDYPINPFGDAASGDKAYQQLVDLTLDTDLVLNTISGLFTRSGWDYPESQLVALFQAATGAGQDLSGVGFPGASIPPGQQANFRDGATKLFLLWTDASFHHPRDPGDIPYPGPSFEETCDAILALDPPLVLGISSGGGGVSDLEEIAAATNALAPAGGVDCDGDGIVDVAEGEPLVCGIASSGAGIGEAITALVEAAADLPIADAGGPYTGGVGETITFDGSGSFDPDGTIVLYEWDFESDGVFDFSSANPTATHIYLTEFSGTATLRVTDNDGGTGTDTAAVEVQAPPKGNVYLPLIAKYPTPTPAPTYTATPTATAITPTSTPTPTNTPTPLPSDQLIINCGFESDEGWVFGDTPRPAAYTTEDAHWGARSVRLGIKPPTTDAYSWSSVRQRITIPANARSAILSFWYKPFTECTCRDNWQQFDWSDFGVDQPNRIRPNRNPLSWASCDWQQALILADDFPNPTILATVMNITSNSGVWTHQTFDLTPFAGRTIWVYFNVYNDGWGYGRTWMYVDDASVMVYY
jgi:hypothetical protein